MHCSIRSTILLIVFYFLINFSTHVGRAVGQRFPHADLKPDDAIQKKFYAKLAAPYLKNAPIKSDYAMQHLLTLPPTKTPSPQTTTLESQETTVNQELKQNFYMPTVKFDSTSTTPFFPITIDQNDEDSILTEAFTTNGYTLSNATTTIQNSTAQKSNQKLPDIDLNYQSTTNVHPLLIYSLRYEIRSYDLFTSPANLSSRSQSITNAANTYNTAQIFNNNPGAQHSSSTPTRFDQQQQQQQHQPNNKHSKTLMAGLKNTIGLDFYYSDSESFIFWTDVNEERIYRGTIINSTITNLETIVQGCLATAEGLAVDWIGLNIYWVESTLDHIEVANMNGTSRKTLLAGDMESPRAIAVDPKLGYLFWSDWDKKRPRIERATMSGQDRKTLVNIKEVQGGWPNGLTLDYDSLKIYWIDANSDSIHVVDYEGNNHQQLLKQIKSLGHPFSITLYKENLYWTDWKTNSITMANKYTGADARELLRITNRLFDIKVFHPSRQPKIDQKLNPCHVNNGNCSHLCLLSVNHTYKCECPSLMKLDLDDRTCLPSEKVLLIGRNNEIRAVDINKPLYHVMAPISVPKVFVPKQFEYYSKTKTIFWADSQTNEVKRIQLGGTSIETIIDVIVETPTGLALDWISGNIYVTSSMQNNMPGKIYISNLEGEYISILMDNNSHNLQSPKSIAVHPVLGLLFCIDEGNVEKNIDAIIFKASMDGRNKQIISSKLNNSKLDNPISLSIDYQTNRVYWINQGNESSDASIQYYDIKKDIVSTFFDESDMPPSERINPIVLSVDGDSLIVGSSKRVDAIIRISTNELLNKTLLRTQNLEQLSALKVYNSSTQVGINPCSINNGNCSQLCIPSNIEINNSVLIERTCKCTMGYTNNPANMTECVGKDLFLIYSYNLGMKGISLEPNSSADDYYLPPIHRAFRASSIDFVHKDNLIYWVDNEEGSITRINRDTTNYKLIVQGLESEESIAIDWIAGNLYWLDPYYDIIEVARLNGTNRYVIVSGEMEKPNGIVVNPLKGYIAWSDVGTYPRIEVAQLDGSNRKVIVNSNISHVDDLAIDYTDNYIYWFDSNLAIIECVKPDGSQRRVVYNSSSYNHLVSIAIYKDYLYIANSVQNHGSIIRCDKKDINSINCEEILQNLGEGIRDIAIFAEQPMPDNFNQNPCVINNGGCQDLCLFMGKAGKKRCMCSHGKLASDELTCKPYDTFVLFSKLTQIDTLHITDEVSSNNSPYHPILMENRSNIISLTVDYNAQRVIYSDMTRDQICSVFFNGTERKVLVEKQNLVEGIAFSNNQLYWTSIHDFSISRLNVTSSGIITNPSCSVDNNSCGKSVAQVEKIVRLSNDDKPRGIVVDVCTSYVYWTNWNTNASIQRASPHNGYKVESIIKTNIKVPNGITIDHSLRKLYWCDAKIDKIEACDMDGTNRYVLISALPQHPFALSVWDNYVFWTDWLAKGVFKADKYTGLNPVLIKKVSQRPMGITVAASDNIECPIDHCINNNGGCPADTVCIMHYPDHKTTGTVECRTRNHLITEHPLARCKHSKNGTMCNSMSYLDIIENSMERYNMTDLSPIEFSKPNWTSSIQPVSSTEINTESATTDYILPQQNQHHFVEAEKDNNNNQTETSTLGINFNYTSTTKTFDSNSFVETTPFSDIQNNTTIVSDNNNNNNQTSSKTYYNNLNNDKVLISTVKPIIQVTTPKQLESGQKNYSIDELKPFKQNTTIASNESQTTNQQTSTLPPCQISPAALQTVSSTESCKLPGEFKCYLSEKLLCIPSDRRCDGNHDCPSKEDENDCYLSKMGPSYNLKRESNWHRFVTVILVILGAAVTALFLVFGTKGRRRWFVVGSNEAFNHTRMFDDNGTNIEISNPMFDEDDSGNLVHCPFSIDLNETTNFSNPLYERQVLLMNDKHSKTPKDN